jgi:hypothetical protein
VDFAGRPWVVSPRANFIDSFVSKLSNWRFHRQFRVETVKGALDSFMVKVSRGGAQMTVSVRHFAFGSDLPARRRSIPFR